MVLKDSVNGEHGSKELIRINMKDCCCKGGVVAVGLLSADIPDSVLTLLKNVFLMEVWQLNSNKIIFIALQFAHKTCL